MDTEKLTCTECNERKPVEEFHKCSNRTRGHQYRCKACKKLYRAAQYIKTRETELAQCAVYRAAYPKLVTACRKRYRAANPNRRYETATYRARKLKATPKWADHNKIKEIYKNCPKGYHVDHVLPLRGRSICGLHVETNLQYLTAADNLSKSNHF